ncbi:hypothetical protein N431DRAFT_224239 [Stipitochalara longipes BDJ]|nr:hypothetical protein N431DRAFT_224239 [Stipitochalara longipes BDJ]
MRRQWILATAAQNSVACGCFAIGQLRAIASARSAGNLGWAGAVRTSHVLRQRRVCDAGLQTGVRQQPRPVRRPRSAPATPSQQRAPPKHDQRPPNIMLPPEQTRPTCVKLLSASFLHPSVPPMQPMGRRLSERSCCGRGHDWLRCWREGDLPAVTARSPRPDDLRIFKHPVRPWAAKGFFKVATSRTDPRRSSLQPGPAKDCCTPSLILRSP